MKIFKWFFPVVLASMISSGFAQPIIEIEEGDELLIGRNLEFFVDTTNSLLLDDVVTQSFQPGQHNILNLGNTTHQVWIRFSIQSDDLNDIFLEIKAPLLEVLEVYKWSNGSGDRLFKGGFLEPFSQRPVSSENWLIPLSLTPGTANTFYLKGRSGYPFQIPITLASKDRYVTKLQMHNLFWGLYFGVMIFALFYNLFIYLSVKERTYLYYILYIIGSVIFYLGLQGFSFKFLWPNLPVLNMYLPVIICVTNSIITLFSMDFLRITRARKGQYYFGWAMIAGFLLIALLNFVAPYGMAVGLAQMLSLVACIYFIYIAVQSLRRGVTTAKYYLLAWTLFLVFVVIFILASNNVIVSNFFTTHCIFIGHMTEVALLSFALADRINFLKKENEEKQKEIIHQLEENEEIQRKANEELSQKVIERTREVVEQKNEAERQRERSDELLLNILPKETAEELKRKGKANAKLIDHVTVLFTDIMGFVSIAGNLSPTDLVHEINECFSAYDHIMDQMGVEKIKTIGDAYMAAGGIPSPNETHAKDVVKAALEIQKFMSALKIRKEKEGKIAFQIRIGIHTGPVIAGIVGIKKFAYDIWGNTVNVANVMETYGTPGKINISATTYDMIKDDFVCKPRGKVETRKLGPVDMYFVEGEKGA